jgi:hypothetical protein
VSLNKTYGSSENIYKRKMSHVLTHQKQPSKIEWGSISNTNSIFVYEKIQGNPNSIVNYLTPQKSRKGSLQEKK